MAPRHIGQGSHVVYRSQPESWKSPSLRQASRIATTSACAVGSFVVVTRLAPSATTRPSFTTSAANGPPPPVRTFSSPKAMARRMKSADMILCPCSECAFNIIHQRWPEASDIDAAGVPDELKYTSMAVGHREGPISNRLTVSRGFNTKLSPPEG